MNRLNRIAGACAATLTLTAAIPAFAQSSAPASGTRAADNTTYTSDTRKEGTNWGWLGLLGLAGLMGLKGRDDDKYGRTRTNTSTPGRA